MPVLPIVVLLTSRAPSPHSFFLAASGRSAACAACFYSVAAVYVVAAVCAVDCVRRRARRLRSTVIWGYVWLGGTCVVIIVRGLRAFSSSNSALGSVSLYSVSPFLVSFCTHASVMLMPLPRNQWQLCFCWMYVVLQTLPANNQMCNNVRRVTRRQRQTLRRRRQPTRARTSLALCPCPAIPARPCPHQPHPSLWGLGHSRDPSPCRRQQTPLYLCPRRVKARALPSLCPRLQRILSSL